MRTVSPLLPARPLSARLLGTSAPGHRAAQPTHYVLGHPGRPARLPTLLIAVFDNSGSVTSPAGTDPLSNRFAEVEHAFAVVARRGARHELGAVVHFDTPSGGEVGPVSITRRGLAALRSGLRIPPDGAGTSELAPSLARATEVAMAHPGYEVTLVVLSDFLLLDADPLRVLDELASFPGTVHAVVLGTRMPAGMLDEHVTVTHIGRDDPPGAVARAVFSSLVANRPGSSVAGDPASSLPIPQPKFRRHGLRRHDACKRSNPASDRSNTRPTIRPT